MKINLHKIVVTPEFIEYEIGLRKELAEAPQRIRRQLNILVDLAVGCVLTVGLMLV